MLETVIFAIDNSHDVHQQAKFLRHVDTLRVMGKLRGLFALCIGSYKGDMERSYMMLATDYEKHIPKSGYVDNQESILRVPGDVRQPCTLEYFDGRREVIGPMKRIHSSERHLYDGWTYVEKTGAYYVC
jgi:hypothetical protein